MFSISSLLMPPRSSTHFLPLSNPIFGIFDQLRQQEEINTHFFIIHTFSSSLAICPSTTSDPARGEQLPRLTRVHGLTRASQKPPPPHTHSWINSAPSPLGPLYYRQQWLHNGIKLPPIVPLNVYQRGGQDKHTLLWWSAWKRDIRTERWEGEMTGQDKSKTIKWRTDRTICHSWERECADWRRRRPKVIVRDRWQGEIRRTQWCGAITVLWRSFCCLCGHFRDSATEGGCFTFMAL